MAIQIRDQFPSQWIIGKEFDPADHLMKIDRYDRIAQKKTSTEYMNVQSRLMWFIRDQRMMIAAGLATTSYTIQTDLIEMDRDRGYAHFKTYIRDVLGNEVTMYGSETAQDFPDFSEKASTKSLGRALLLLGYGTAFATEFDEGERVVDAPQESRARSGTVAQHTSKNADPSSMARTGTIETMASERQIASIHKLCASLGRKEPNPAALTYSEAQDLLRQLSQAYAQTRQTVQ